MSAASFAQSFAHLPVQMGGAALSQAGRAALWVVARFMRSPLTNSAILALVVTTAMAGSNALYGQHHMHPSPLFGGAVADGSVDPVIPAVKPKGLGEKPLVVGTPKKLEKVALTDSATGSIGNEDVFEVQKKLEAMKFFTGTVDGYYGPQTAKAIRKFEEAQGLKLTGELTPEIIAKIKNTPLAVAQPKPAVIPAPAAVAEPEPVAVEEKPAINVMMPKVVAPKAELSLPEAKPAAEAEETVKPQSLAALAEPAPLTSDITTGSIGTPKKKTATVLGRPLPDTPGEALEMAADTAGDAINTIIDGVQTVAMNKPGAATPFAAEGQATLTTTPTVAEASPDNPQVGIPLKIDEEPAKPGTPIAVLDTPATPGELAPVSVNDPVTVAKVQRGLGSLGFLHGPADGVAGDATAKAIRNFEVYFNYKVTGRISPELLDLLVENGASI
jgi:peptidoglycan hydrolase-like protein with peptidoglycan-binding domain